jgi:hypothetical protein
MKIWKLDLMLERNKIIIEETSNLNIKNKNFGI